MPGMIATLGDGRVLETVAVLEVLVRSAPSDSESLRVMKQGYGGRVIPGSARGCDLQQQSIWVRLFRLVLAYVEEVKSKACDSTLQLTLLRNPS